MSPRGQAEESRFYSYILKMSRFNPFDSSVALFVLNFVKRFGIMQYKVKYKDLIG